MKREIKFRAWDKRRSVMIGTDYPDNWADNKDEWYCDVAMMDLCGIEDICKDKDYAVMQYTGLKDRNGKEVWEGDIIEVDKGRHKYTDVVEWRENITNRDYDVRAHGFEFPAFGGFDEFEVIGNIYENPELIKK